MPSIRNILDTWNNSLTTFNAFKINVTDTNSAADSKLVDLQVDDVSKFSVDKAGKITLGGAFSTNSQQINESKGADVASAAGLTLGADGNYFDITGTTTVTSIDALGVGTEVTLHFDGILTLTHHATNLILPSGANIITAAGDEAIFREYATGDWRCISYSKASGEAVAGGDLVEDTTPQLGGPLDANSQQINESKGADVASATALTLGSDGNYFDITGTTAILSIVTRGIGTEVALHFDDILTLTHHATDLILPGGANIITAAGDEAIFREYATGDWRCILYSPASGFSIGTPAFESKLLHVRDEKASTVDGGTSVAGAWTKRVLNTVVDNEISGASLASDQITLPSGDYYIVASSPFYRPTNISLRLMNVTDAAATEAIGQLYSSNVSAISSIVVQIRARFSIAATKTFELQYYATNGVATVGLGPKSTQQVGVFTDVSIWRVS